MTYSAEEANEAAAKLVELTLKANELNSEIKDLKANLIEYAEIENIKETSWSSDNGFVELTTKVTYKPAEIPFETKVDADACPIDIAEQAFTSRLVLTKEGKQMLREEYPTLMKLMVASSKLKINVTV